MESSRNIIQYLQELAIELIHLQMPTGTAFHLLVAGGAYMLIQEKRQSTEDIDFALLEMPAHIPQQNTVFRTTIQHGEISAKKSIIPNADTFKRAVKIVAQRNTLPDDWMNDEAAVYYYDDAPQADVLFWRSFENVLYVYLPTMQYMLATKIAAYRQKDRRDITLLLQALNIQTREEARAIVDTFLLPEAQEFWKVETTLNRLFRVK